MELTFLRKENTACVSNKQNIAKEERLKPPELATASSMGQPAVLQELYMTFLSPEEAPPGVIIRS